MTTPVQPRCHLHLPIINSAGEVFPYASITLNDDSGAPLPVDVYVQAEGGNPVSFPVFMDPAVVDLWLDGPARVQIVAEVTDNVRIVLDGIDILPTADNILTTPSPLSITGADYILNTAVLMAAGPNQAAFRVTDPVGTHQHEGDSAGSVSLTGEAPTDFNPYQTWVGYQAGENNAPASSGSSAFGAHALLDGSSATVMGQAQITTQTSTGVDGDQATVLSSQNSTATQGSTVAGGGNLTAQGRNMAVLGSLNGPSSGSVVPDNTVVIGSGNIFGAAGTVKIGPNHPSSSAGTNHVSIGAGNNAQNNSLPWAGAQTPIALGANISLSGDPSDQVSATDWFGGVGPLAMGTNSTDFSPSITLLQGNAVTQVALRVAKDVVVNGQRTHSNATTTLGFFGSTGVVRPNAPVDSGSVSNSLLTSLMSALANMGLIYTNSVPLVYEGGHHADGTLLEFAETGQALQWKLPPTSPDYRATNPFTCASSKVVLNSATGPFPSRGVPAIYSAGRSDVIVQGQFVYNSTLPVGTNAITNFGFEVDTTGWQGWDGGVVISRDTTKAKFGDASGRIAGNGGTGYSRAATTFSTTPGTQACWSVWVYPQVNHPVVITIDWFDSGWAYLGNNGAWALLTNLPLNTWTRISVGGTAPASTANMACTVGYSGESTTAIPATDYLNIDGAMLQFGVTSSPIFTAYDGYHPDDKASGLMIRCLHEKSISGGQTIATTKGYLISRTNVYSMAGNAITGTVATHSTPVATGQMLQADCNGNSIIVRANGTQISTFTDSTWTTRVKYGYRITDTTKVSDFLVLPFGF